MSKGVVRAARSGGIVLTGAILATSGLYVVVYLARWEWNRAIICALIFISALITLSTVLVLQSLRRVDDRLAAIERANADDVREVLRGSNVDAAAERHFEWLRRSTNTTAVFVPVLLGTGALLSIIAYAIERLAGLFAGATLDARTAAILPLDLPLSTLAPEPRRAISGEVPQRNRRPALVAVVLVLALALGGVEALRRATQSRERELVGPGSTTLTIELHRKDLTLSPTAAAGALWVACRGQVPGNPTLTQAVADDNQVVIAIDAALGATGRARIIGCLEDFTIDRVLADVTAVEVVSSAGG